MLKTKFLFHLPQSPMSDSKIIFVSSKFGKNKTYYFSMFDMKILSKLFYINFPIHFGQ